MNENEENLDCRRRKKNWKLNENEKLKWIGKYTKKSNFIFSYLLENWEKFKNCLFILHFNGK